MVHFADVFDPPLRLTPDQAVGAPRRRGVGARAARRRPDGPLARGVAKLAGRARRRRRAGARRRPRRRRRRGPRRAAHGGRASTGGSQLDYYSYGRDDRTERDVDPYLVHAEDGSLYLLGHCHLAGGERRLPGRPHRQRHRCSTSSFDPPATGRPTGVFQPDADDPRVVLDLEPDGGWVRGDLPRRGGRATRATGRLRVTLAGRRPGLARAPARRPRARRPRSSRRPTTLPRRRAAAPAAASSPATVDQAVTDTPDPTSPIAAEPRGRRAASTSAAPTAERPLDGAPTRPRSGDDDVADADADAAEPRHRQARTVRRRAPSSSGWRSSRRPRGRPGRQDLPVPGLLHPVGLDGAHARARATGCSSTS